MVKAAVHPDPLSEHSIARLRHWVTRYDKSDDRCKVVDMFLPTRVLDVDELQAIKLCESRALADRRQGSYIALSHCWEPSKKTFLTTRDTIKEMKAGFPIEEFSATFRDVLITRGLGIRYISIDSLSIIQQDNTDRELEASRMGSVYANSLLTVAAANAKGDHDGFLHRRADTLIPLAIASSIGRSTQVYLQAQKNGIEVHGYNTNQPLDTRGWTLQERYLPQRTLQFGSTEISWACQCIDLHESEIDPYNGISNSIALIRLDPTDSGIFSYISCYSMVLEYTDRVLTYDTDKLPALSGLATEVAKFKNGIYNAGLRWEDVASGMLWYRGGASKLKKPSEYLAPSWSWVSLNGGVIYNSQPQQVTLADVAFHECYLERGNETPNRAVKSGWLDLSAPLVKLIKIETSPLWKFVDKGLETAFRFPHLDNNVIERKTRLYKKKARDPYSSRGNFETRGNFDLTHKDHTEVLGLFLQFFDEMMDFGLTDTIS